jgi:hypothetical protein
VFKQPVTPKSRIAVVHCIAKPIDEKITALACNVCGFTL